ncbi:MAG: hypothetical protein KDB01_22850, partial [Planctomycetaceae bacterium]|nr:hypothetical protein [Planctomycetaceae bacterium]
MDEMTGPGEDSQKHKSDDAAKYLAESFFGLNLNPADVGGEVLFDDYDDSRTAQPAGDSSVTASADLDDSVAAFSSPSAGRSSVPSPPNRFEENLDDLIVFSDDDDDEDDVQVDDDEDEDDDDENFDFGDDDDEDDEDDDDLDEDEDFEDDDEEEDEEEDEDELDDVELDFGDDVMPPAPKKVVPVAQDPRGARSDRGSAGRDVQRPAPQHRGERGVRPQESSSARAESRTSDRSPLAKSADTGRKTAASDDQYWNELDGWVWDDEAKKKPAAILPADEDDNDDDDDESENADASSSSRSGDDEDAPKRKRGRRRGGRGRGRGRRDEKESATSAASTSNPQRGSVDFDDDFSEIMFEEDQEDFVSVSAGSAKAQRRMQDEPTPPAARNNEEEIDEEDDEDSGETAERVDAGDNRGSGSRRGRRGRRGRGPGRTEAQEPARGDDRAPARGPRNVHEEDEIDDDVVEDDIELVEFSDQDDEEEVLPR